MDKIELSHRSFYALEQWIEHQQKTFTKAALEMDHFLNTIMVDVERITGRPYLFKYELHKIIRRVVAASNDTSWRESEDIFETGELTPYHQLILKQRLFKELSHMTEGRPND